MERKDKKTTFNSDYERNNRKEKDIRAFILTTEDNKDIRFELLIENF